MRERYQNPVAGDSVRLRLFVFNQNNYTDVQVTDKIDVYFLDPAGRSPENPDGRRLVQTVPAADIVKDDTGKYYADVLLTDKKYVIGKYLDIWTMQFENEPQPGEITNSFAVYPDMWYTSPIPVVYDFQFRFSPNRMRQGEKKFIRIEILPQVPQASDLARYYENLAIVSDLILSVEQNCGPCLPAEQDLRLVIDREHVTFREKKYGYYQLDTRDLDCGVYNVWFELNFGDNVYISEKMQFQIL